MLVPREYDGEIFQSGTRTDSVHPENESGRDNKNRFHVLSIGHETISASRPDAWSSRLPSHENEKPNSGQEKAVRTDLAGIT